LFQQNAALDWGLYSHRNCEIGKETLAATVLIVNYASRIRHRKP
jgi:hypothetical protein